MQNENKLAEAQDFVGRMGAFYCEQLATKEERNYLEGILYENGTPIPSMLHTLSCRFPLPVGR